MAQVKKNNKAIAEIFSEMADLLEINSVPYKPKAYRKAAQSLHALEQDVALIYKEKGRGGLRKIAGIGESIAGKIEEYLKKKKIAQYEELKEKTMLRDIVTHYFETKGVSLEELKRNARKQKIVYARFAKAAKQLLLLAGSAAKAKHALSVVAAWAKSNKLDYTIDTVFKRWPELDRLKPKERVRKPFYRGSPMVWVESKKKWFVVRGTGDWLEFVGDEKDIEWRMQS
ncbi:MAG: hypothetical protein HY458_02405 [Parcubacteria group bacterium]|nr:hypothetical protein [Parcubacteria group bacterium]